MSRRFWSASAVAVTVGLLVAACGGGSATPAASAGGGTHAAASAVPDAAVLRGQVITAMKQARSVHVSGSVSQGAQQTAVDVVLTRAGGIGGSLSVQGHSVSVRTSGGHVYILVSRSLSKWQKIPSAACALMCGKWLEESSSGLRSLTGDAGWTKIVTPFSVAMAHASASYGGKTTVNGQPAMKLNFAGLGTVYVAAQGTPYPLRIQHGSNLIVYSGWNTATLPPPPPASKVISKNQL